MTISTATYKAIHPFPARMAPEIAYDECKGLPLGSVVVDPMVGSGTTVHAAAKAGLIALGSDVDPLAVLMSKVRTTPIDADEFIAISAEVSNRARSRRTVPQVPWIDEDLETRKFVDYWFASTQQNQLRTLAIEIARIHNSSLRAALECSFSRLIVTKTKGASLGRDVSHSRPHKVADENDFDVLRNFDLVTSRMAVIFRQNVMTGSAVVVRGDARSMGVSSGCADIVISSPPYLNAIDYLRGHRLSLVWFGYPVSKIREIRGESVGTERGFSAQPSPELTHLRHALGGFDTLSSRYMRIVDRYLLDLAGIYREQARILRSGGRAVTVIGNSAVRGSFLNNDEAAVIAAEISGLVLTDKTVRPLPADRRYLPPPQRNSAGAALQSRMRTETILRFEKRG